MLEADMLQEIRDSLMTERQCYCYLLPIPRELYQDDSAAISLIHSYMNHVSSAVAINPLLGALEESNRRQVVSAFLSEEMLDSMFLILKEVSEKKEEFDWESLSEEHRDTIRAAMLLLIGNIGYSFHTKHQNTGDRAVFCVYYPESLESLLHAFLDAHGDWLLRFLEAVCSVDPDLSLPIEEQKTDWLQRIQTRLDPEGDTDLDVVTHVFLSSSHSTIHNTRARDLLFRYTVQTAQALAEELDQGDQNFIN